jgi:tRNA G18 (ribose-2'-O)-methylase SpoU
VIAITSLDDDRVSQYRAVAGPGRLEAEGLFVVEGRLVVPRLLALSAERGRWSGAAQSVLLSAAAFERMQDVVARHDSVPTYVVPQAVMDGLVGFNMHRGCLAMARRPVVPVLTVESVAAARRLIVLEGVNNPDNVGGIFRSAAALGADAIVLGPACADPLYRKSVRTSMGATLDVPYLGAGDWPAVLDLLRARGWDLVALTTDRGALPLARYEPGHLRVALLAGAEGTGLTGPAMVRASRRVTIPMTGRVDSLNVATAVSIALYHAGVSARP